MAVSLERDVTNDEHWTEFTHQWLIRADTTYLNHGSFGPPSQFVKQKRRQWIDELDSQPMDFYCRKLEPELLKTRADLARFVGTESANLVLVENATFGMNVVADSFPLQSGDEVLTNNHEYGAVHRIWNRRCKRVGAKLVSVDLPEKIDSREQVVDRLLSAATERTKILIVSHITSVTALVMPIREIVAAFHQRGIAVVIDGPHAPAQIDLDISSIDCDFYTASCHKWLSATLGSGFLFVHPKWQQHVEPQLKSWGRLMPAMPEHWSEEFTWSGTRDPSAYLSISDAIDYLENHVGLIAFRNRTRFLATQCEEILSSEFGTTPIASREKGWYASMAHIPLPEGHDFEALQKTLWEEYRIETPVSHFSDRWYIRVSFHLYNNQKQIETLKFAIQKYLV